MHRYSITIYGRYTVKYELKNRLQNKLLITKTTDSNDHLYVV